MQLINPKTDEEVPLDSMQSLQGVDAFIFVYDVTDNDTFVQFSYWLEVNLSSHISFAFRTDLSHQRSKLRTKLPGILAANRVDDKSAREVSTEKGKALADQFRLGFFEVSAKTGENVRPSIEALLASVATSKSI